MTPDERNWRFRISLYHIQDKDEGEYTCATPRGHSNSITIIVKSNFSYTRLPGDLHEEV